MGIKLIQREVERFRFINDGFGVLMCDKIHIPDEMQITQKNKNIILIGISEIESLFCWKDILSRYFCS